MWFAVYFISIGMMLIFMIVAILPHGRVWGSSDLGRISFVGRASNGACFGNVCPALFPMLL